MGNQFGSEQRGPSAGSRPAAPLFIGGVPRSGTHAVAGLLARHSRYAMVPRELGFHTGVGAVGLPDLFNQRISVQEFTEVMSGYWWKRITPWDSTVTRGLYKTIPRDRFEQCLERFERTYPSAPVDAGQAFIQGLIDPIAEDAGKEAWIEMDPYNIFVAPLLYRLFPEMKFIHVLRDGRDVAVSTASMPWGRAGALTGVWRWQRILRVGHQRLRLLPTDRLLTIRLEDLALRTREDTYARILDFLELRDEPAMHTFFREGISPRKAHIARWRGLPFGRRTAISGAYACALGRLASAGVASRPTFRASRMHIPPANASRLTQAAPIDPWADGAARDA
jgi:hypothetical protein